MKKIILFVFVTFYCAISSFSQNTFTRYVDPFIGTGGHGHTYPGAVLPHGMVQLSPDTRLEGWDGCGGYHYSDNFIYGFTHTHLSGTGVPDYCDVLLMPMSGKPTPDNKVYGSKFSHENEKASPGFYSVLLSDNNILAELTTTPRVGFHRYTFTSGGNQNIILDLVHREKVLESSIKIIGNNRVEGLRRSQGWARNQYVYFSLEFSKPFTTSGVWVNDTLHNDLTEINNKSLKAYFQFSVKNKEPIMVKVAISQVSAEGARKNMFAELPDWNFDKVKADADKIWNKELNKIDVSGGSNSQLRTFHTALYHTMVVPNIASDVDGQYRGRDNKIHTANFNYYTVFSLWDTYRACHPLYTIIDQARTLDYIKTFLSEYKEGGRLPVWELSSNETDCMIGYHSVPVIVDAAAKGIDKFDKILALEAMEKSATGKRYGLPALMDHGYLEADDENENVSRTLEYAYDDWCIAKFAKMINKLNDYKVYIQRAQGYKNLLDPVTGFMRPKKNGNWITPFDPKQVDNNFTEANSWQYTFYAPQDINGYTSLLGGRQRLERKLDSLFSETSDMTGRDQSDITGLIGQYAHGNEPSHHITYLYNFTGKAYKTQEKVHQVMSEMYHDTPNGLAGNEDCGQMSAWYVLSSLGFYPVTPGTTDYMIGTPLFSKATLHLENGKTFTIDAKNVSNKNFYIQSATLNGKDYSKSNFSHFDIMKGGNLHFVMTNKPTTFGNKDFPSTSINDNLIVLNPVIDGGNNSFSGNKQIKIYSEQSGVKIYYTKSEETPGIKSELYTKPFTISADTKIKTIAVNTKGEISKVTTAQFHKRTNDFSIISLTPFEQEYSAGSKEALIDEIKGTTDWRKGNWQGFQKNDLEVVIDLKNVEKISTVSADFLQDTGAWIIMPKEVSVQVSGDNKNYKEVYKTENLLPIEDLKVKIKEVVATFPITVARYVKLKAMQYGKLPAWHESAGSDSHIFIDEISVK